MKQFLGLVLLLSRPSVAFYTLIWLMVLLVLGTIAQKYVGLYIAQNIFFSSWVIWLGFVPLPAGMAIMGLLTVSLIAKIFFASRWSFQNSGIIITHIGVLLLMLGGLVTYISAKEGAMLIYEGEKINYFSDYHLSEFVVENANNGDVIFSVLLDDIKQGDIINIADLSIDIKVVKSCKNCDIFMRDDKGSSDNNLDIKLKGMAARMDIAPIALEKDGEQNRGAIQFEVIGADNDQDGIYFSTDFIDKYPQIEIGGNLYNMALRRKRTILPFEIELINFEKKLHPATNKPKSFKSEIILHENGAKWRSIIQMNEPLRYRGYTFYQSSYIQDGEKEATVFAVVKNAGRLFPYVASTILCIGLLIHMLLRLPKLIRKRKFSILIFSVFSAILFYSPNIYAKDINNLNSNDSDFEFSSFAKIPILDDGRIKPLDTFARTYLEIMSSRSSLSNMSAIEWLAEVVFNPNRSYSREVFYIPNPRVVDFLGLEQRKSRRYSYKEVAVAFYRNIDSWKLLFSMKESDMSLPQKQLLELYDKVELFSALSRSLSLLSPDFIVDGEVAKLLGVEPKTAVNFFKLRTYQKSLDEMFLNLEEKVKDKNYTLSEQDLMLAYLMKEIKNISGSYIFRVIPPQWGDDDKWYSPLDVTIYGQGSPAIIEFLNLWEKAIKYYRNKDFDNWNKTTSQIFEASINMSANINLENLLSLETYFNNAKPFNISFIFYLFAMILIMASFIIYSEKLRKLALYLIIAGLSFHIIGISIRMFIMQRPPVTNLYETIIFVSFISVLFGAFMEARLKNTLGIIIASSIGVILHFMGVKFDAEGDTMGMLAAVLDTNFWLATHVVTITIGYGICLVGGVLGHVYLIKNILNPSDKKYLGELFKNMRGVLFVALFFTSLGTILGGIWADQSWGRFWGWDPKENGALLIVIWLAILVHGYWAGKFKELGFAIGMVLNNIIVAIAWFGVNLLSIGLHSYGFTQSAAFSFIIFVIFELIFIIISFSIIKYRINKASADNKG